MKRFLPAFRDRFGEAALYELHALACAVLEISPVELHGNPEGVLSSEQIEKLNAAAQKRLAGWPLSRIVGWVWFCDSKIFVNEHVLVPRHETEWWLTEYIADCRLQITEYESNHRDVVTTINPQSAIRSPQLFLDLGTGSGTIAIALAKNFPDAQVYAIDISEAALQVARDNARVNGVLDGITFLQGDLLTPLSLGRGVGGEGILVDRLKREDLIIFANLPYIPSDVIPTLDIEVAAHDPLLALDGGSDGLDLLRRFFAEAEFLPAGTCAVLEVGINQVEQLRHETFWQQAWQWLRVFTDLGGIERAVEFTRLY